jgi:hypothetical protein
MEIFIKLSCDPAIASGDKLASCLSEAGSFIGEFSYEDEPSFDAFAAWLRRDKNAPVCGPPKKF